MGVHQLGLRFAGGDGAKVDSCSLVWVAGSRLEGSWPPCGDTDVALLAHQWHWSETDTSRFTCVLLSGVQGGNWLFCGRPINKAKTCKNSSSKFLCSLSTANHIQCLGKLACQVQVNVCPLKSENIFKSYNGLREDLTKTNYGKEPKQ